MKTKFINYFFDKEVIENNKKYTNLVYYSIFGIVLITLILGAL